MSHSEVGRSSSCGAGVSVARTSTTFANADTISDTGATTLKSRPS
jgi:hypothetical protein